VILSFLEIKLSLNIIQKLYNFKASYTANLTAFLTEFKESRYSYTLEQLVYSGEYKLAIIPGSALDYFLKVISKYFSQK
jgi:hypothetical protein